MGIRRAAADDVPRLARLHLRGWQVGFRGVVADEILDRLSLDDHVSGWTRMLCDSESDRRTWVGEIGDRVVGYCAVGPTHQADEGLETGEVYGMYVDPDYFRGGWEPPSFATGSKTYECWATIVPPCGCYP